MRKTSSLLLTIILLAFAITVLSCGGGSHPTPTQTQAPTTATVAFMQAVQGQNYLFTPMLGQFAVSDGNIQFTASAVKDLGTGQPVTATFYSDVLSPDGKKAAVDLYAGDGVTQNWDIWVGNSDGSGTITRVTDNGTDNRMPQFSPDGNKLVFQSAQWQNGYNWQIDTINVDGSGEKLLPIPAGVSLERAPAYSPDGGKIVFYASGYDEINKVEFAGIWVMNADGSNPKMLTNPWNDPDCTYCYDDFPSYTADGSKIVFTRQPYPPYSSDIFIMNADASGITKLTDSVGINFDPQIINLKGVGEKIIFSSNRSNPNDTTGKYFDIYSMNIDGTGITQLTSNSLYDAFCAWWGGYGGDGTRQTPRQRLGERPPHGPAKAVRW